MLMYLIMILNCCEYALYSLCVNVFSLLSLFLYYGEYLKTSSILPEYDYIVVGSGTAGSLITHRLSTETDHSYVVLEAGVYGSFLTDVPVLGPLLQGSVYDWGFETLPQENACRSMNDKKCKWPRGKVVGGSAILNNMVHIRGNLTNYVDWFQGIYSHEYIEKQFEYIEKHLLYVDEPIYHSLLTNAILDAASELGYEIRDLNKEFNTGFMKSQVNQKNGGRWSTSHMLRRNKHNLVHNTVVEKIVIRNNVAYGVEYRRNGISGTIRARKGVIIAAGTIGTAKLLLLSGIGPKQHLKEVGVPLVKDLPVGKNLQDHVTTGLDLIVFNQSLNLGATDMMNPFHVLRYLFEGKGPFTSPGCEVVGILSTVKSKLADLQFMVLPVGITSDRGVHLKNAIGIKDSVWTKYFAKIFKMHTASVLPILLHPKSKGDIQLRTKNPNDYPLIDPRYLTVKQDIDILVRGLEIVTEFVNTEAMKCLGAYINPQVYPNCENFEIFSKQYWECYVRELTLTSFHPVGTCKMGPKECADSVVDTNFQVIGLKRLYVADGSVLPTLPSGNINAAIALMANIFFENHFIFKGVRDKEVCQRMDLIFSFYLKVCIQSVNDRHPFLPDYAKQRKEGYDFNHLYSV